MPEGKEVKVSIWVKNEYEAFVAGLRITEILNELPEDVEYEIDMSRLKEEE